MNSKICTKCLEEKAYDCFSVKKGCTNNLNPVCKLCYSLESKLYREQNKEKIQEKAKNYYLNNKKTINEKAKIYREENKEKIQKKSKKYYKNNKLVIDEKNKKYLRYNKEKRKKYEKDYIKNNQEKLKEYRKKYFQQNKDKIKEKLKNRRKIDLNFKISSNLRARIRNAIQIGNKKNTTKELLGCSIEELKIYLEKQFRDGMNWDNYGSFWHIDHIKPCCTFDLSLESEQKQCFNFKNLQPLLKEENLRKNGKWIQQIQEISSTSTSGIVLQSGLRN